MIRIPKKHSELAQAIVASFRPTPLFSPEVFRDFTDKQWACTEAWLDCSGLALYFLDRAVTFGWSKHVPFDILSRLQAKQAHNKERIAALLGEFHHLNHRFSAAGIAYANLKGFTLPSESCAHPWLRSQSDLDFLITEKEMERASEILCAEGYRLAGRSATSLEFKGAGDVDSSIEAQYTARMRREVELHVPRTPDTIAILRDGHVVMRVFNDPQRSRARYPCLDAPDQFIHQALHIFQHLRNEHTKLSWLLEFRNHAAAKQNDERFWNQVRLLADENVDARVAIGLATMLVEKLFGSLLSSLPLAEIESQLHPAVRHWAERFGVEAVLADVPGTKFYLFLESALRISRHPTSKNEGIRRLFPIALPAARLGECRKSKHRSLSRRIDIFFFRLSFHSKQNLRFLRNWPAWAKICRHIESMIEGNSAVRKSARRPAMTALPRDETR